MRGCFRASGALLCLVLAGGTALAAGVPPHEATREQSKEAQKEFDAADKLFDDGRYADALKAFRASHAIVASPNARLMIARSLRENKQLVEAYAEFEATIADADAANRQTAARYDQTAAAAHEDLEALKARVGFVQVQLVGAGSGATVSIGSRAFDSDALGKPIVVEPGKVSVGVTATGGAEKTQEVEVAAGQTAEVTLDVSSTVAKPTPQELPPPEEPVVKKVELGPNTSLRTWAWVAGGVGVAGLATFGVFGVMNNSRFDELESDCPAGNCPPGRSEDIDTGRRYQTIANIGLVVGALGIATGTTLFILSGKRADGSSKEQARVRIGPGQVWVGGSF